MNRSDIINEINRIEEQQKVMEKELVTFALELSAPSQVAIIAYLVKLRKEVRELKRMLDVLDFEEITKNF